jgi:hypothetical protein
VPEVCRSDGKIKDPDGLGAGGASYSGAAAQVQTDRRRINGFAIEMFRLRIRRTVRAVKNRAFQNSRAFLTEASPFCGLSVHQPVDVALQPVDECHVSPALAKHPQITDPLLMRQNYKDNLRVRNSYPG